MLGAVVRLGALPALAITVLADRLGRRRTLLATVLGYTALTGATAAAPDTASFVALQTLATTFAQAEILLAVVVIAEELDDAHRGFGIGVFFALEALGVGLAAALLPLVDATPLGWRALYLVGLGPLLLLAWWRRSLPETRRFTVYADGLPRAPRSRRALVAPLRELWHAYPGRLAALLAAVACFAGGGAAADFMGPKYLQDAHGWSPTDVTKLFLVGGALGLCGSLVAGRASDRLGRRRLAVLFAGATPLFAMAFYNAEGWPMALAWIFLVFGALGWDTLLSAYAAELFPTSHRATAAGARLVTGSVFAVLGLAAESALYGILGSHWRAVSVLLVASLAVPCVVALAFPETAGRRLEEIAPERAQREIA
jgi:putative MFS transporter